MTSSPTKNGPNLEPRKLSMGHTLLGGTLGAKSVKPEPQYMTASIKSEAPSNSRNGFASYASMQNKNAPSVKTESSSSRAIPGSFREVVTLDSDSDLAEIIPASEYHDNGRFPHAPLQTIGI